MPRSQNLPVFVPVGTSNQVSQSPLNFSTALPKKLTIDRGIQPLLDLEIELAQISEKFRNNPKTTLILGGDFNAGGINWDNCTVDHDATNRPLKEKLISILDEAGLKQMQREPTRGQNLLDLFCCNKPSLIKFIKSIPGISDHNIVLADCKLKPSIITKPQRKIYQWSKADWRSISRYDHRIFKL